MIHNWEGDEGLASDSRHFGHLAYRDGHMAFVRSPDNISIELLQEGGALELQEPWASMENTSSW